MNHISLNIKTNYELLKSTIKINDLINYAKENKINYLSITDSCMFSFMEFYNSCIKNNIKPIVGIETNFNNDNFYLYAKNYNGYKNLCKIVSYKNFEKLNIDILNKYNDDLICLLNFKNFENINIYKKIYNDTYIFYENKEEKEEVKKVTNKYIYMNKVLEISKNDSEYLKYLYMIKNGENIYSDIKYDFNNNYLYNIEEDDNYEEIINKINLVLPKFEFNLPLFCENSKEYLNSLCEKGLSKRLKNNINAEYKNRLKYELEIINNMHFEDYFLIVYDIILYAKKNNILVGPGRGSAVGSLVSYTLGITEIDPLKYNLLFERFLNPSRVSMPDIDIDIDSSKREIVIEYIKNKYGNSSVANVISFSTFLPKQVVRDVGKVLNLEENKILKISSLLKDNKDFETLEKDNKYIEYSKYNKDILKLIEVSKKLEGLKKNVTVHAAGIVIDKDNLIEKVPIYKNGEYNLVSYDKKYIEQIGILKIDLLSLDDLSFLDCLINDVKEIYKKEINIYNLPLDDKKTLELFNKGNTNGIFQFESEGMKKFLRNIKVVSFNDLIIANAMYRPGPMKMIDSYIKRRNGKEKINYIVPKLENILKETLGIMVYQEQLLEILKEIASYTYEEADNIRIAIKNKNESIILKEKENFIKKALNNKYNIDDINKIFDLIISFANYGFNKSHSVAYAYFGYSIAYIKTNYPLVFYKTILNREIGKSDKSREYINESREYNIEFKGFDINYSKEKYSIENGYLYFPYSLIKNINSLVIKEIEKNKNYTSFLDFIIKVDTSIVTKTIIENLILVGSFDSFNVNKKTLIENLDELINYSRLCKELGKENVQEISLIDYEEYDNNYILEKEKELVGFYFKSHPISKYRKNNFYLKDINLYFEKTLESIFLVEETKEINTKNNEKMAFIKLSDETSVVEGVIFPRNYNNFINIEKGNIVLVNFKVEKRYDKYQLIINKVKKI